MPGSKVESGPRVSAGKRKPFVRKTTIAIALGLLIALASCVLLAFDKEGGFLVEHRARVSVPEPGWLGLGLLVSGLFLANMARMIQIWEGLRTALAIQPARRNDRQRATIHQGFRELFVYTFLATITITGFVYLTAEHRLPWSGLGLDGLTGGKSSPLHIAALLACMFLALTPLVTGLFLQVAYEQSGPRKLLRGDVISPASFWLSTLLIGGIVGLASWAGSVTSLPTDTSLLINLGVMFGVVAAFVSFIFIPHLARYINSLSARAPDGSAIAGASAISLSAPATFASWIDSILVRVVAPLTGATQKGRGVPHGFVLLSLLPLTALGFALAPPYGLIPITVGVLMIVALGRRWAWIEEDRETASRLLKTASPEIQVGFDNDLKDEALLGYATLFIFVPLALYQINGSTGVFEIQGTENPFVAWLAFFGSELAKAVPFVDWWEIYNVDLKSPVEGVRVAIGDHETVAPLAKHLTFAARAMVDLVIMAALLQAVGIWQRTRTQRHLFEIGHVNHFDPFTEQDFFENAFDTKATEPKSSFVEKIKKHVSARKELKLPGEPYNPERLADLLNSQNPKVRKAALWMVHEYQILTGSPQEKLAQLNLQWSNISFPQLSRSASPGDRKRLLEEKYKFEQLVAELSEHRSDIRKRHIGLLLKLLEDIHQTPEFSFSQLEAVWLLGQLSSDFAFLGLAVHVIPNNQPKWRGRIERKFGRVPRLRFMQAPMRTKAYESIESIGLKGNPSPATTLRILDLLDTLSDPEVEGAAASAARAALAAKRIREK